VQQIIYKNKHLIKFERDYEEIKQVNRIRGHINKKPESKKDVYEWEQLLDTKIAPNKSSSGVNVVVNVMQNVQKDGKPLEYKLGDIISSRVS
jgi:hypothetical protein